MGLGQSPSHSCPKRALARGAVGAQGERGQLAQLIVPGNSVPLPCALGSKGYHLISQRKWKGRERRPQGMAGRTGHVGKGRHCPPLPTGLASSSQDQGLSKPVPPVICTSHFAPHLCCSTHQPQCGSPEPRQAIQLGYCSHVSTGSWLTCGQPRQHPLHHHPPPATALHGPTCFSLRR